MLHKDEVVVGEHYWALMGETDELVVVMYVKSGFFEVCGAWECGVGWDDLTVVSHIPKPEGYEDRGLYY